MAGRGDDIESEIDDVDELLDVDFEVIERAVLNDSENGRAIQAGFVENFGSFMVEVVRPILVDVAADGGHRPLVAVAEAA